MTYVAQWVSRDMSDAQPPSANLKKSDYNKITQIGIWCLLEIEENELWLFHDFDKNICEIRLLLFSTYVHSEKNESIKKGLLIP